jgi:hypothetical protein
MSPSELPMLNSGGAVLCADVEPCLDRPGKRVSENVRYSVHQCLQVTRCGFPSVCSLKNPSPISP